MAMFWIVGAIMIFIVSLVILAWLDGKGEVASIEEWLMVAAFMSVIWPLVISCAIVAAPFIGLYTLVKHVASKDGK